MVKLDMARPNAIIDTSPNTKGNQMNLTQAASEMNKEYQNKSWFVAVGEGNNCLYLYVSHQNKQTNALGYYGYKGFTVQVREMNPQPA